MSEEIKPVAWYLSKDPEQEQEPFMTTDGLLASSYEQLGWRRSPLIALPATHRIVPVENLRTLLGVAYIMRQHLRKDSDAIKQMDELQAIADEKD